jgi:diguanylate cyclase (GGDEF)-like protein
MCASVRESDNIARLGGDEFAVVLEDLTDKQQASVVAEKLLEALSQKIVCSGHELAISASIGIACYPDDGKDEQTLLRKADAAMYDAKQSGRNTYRLHSQPLQAQASD